MKRDGRRVMVRGGYILSTYRRRFTKAGLQVTRHGTDHRLILAVLRGEGALCNHRYQQGRNLWPIQTKSVRPQTKGEAAFAYLKGDITRTPRPTKAHEFWISQYTWRLGDRIAALQRAHRARAQEVRQAGQSFQRDLKGNRQRRFRESREDIDALLASDQNQEA